MQPVSRANGQGPPGTKFCKSKGNIDSFLYSITLYHTQVRCLLRLEKAGHSAAIACQRLSLARKSLGSKVLRDNIGSAIRPKNSRPVAPPGFMLHAAADFSGLDVQIFYNLGSYDSPESPL